MKPIGVIGRFPSPRVMPWGQKVRGYVPWEQSQGRMTVRAFVALWARSEGYAVYPVPLPAPSLLESPELLTIRPMQVVAIPGRVYSMRSVRLGA